MGSNLVVTQENLIERPISSALSKFQITLSQRKQHSFTQGSMSYGISFSVSFILVLRSSWYHLAVRLSQYTKLQFQFWYSYYSFFGSCCWETGKFWVNLCFETSDHSVQTADGKMKVISQAFQLTLALYISKSVLYFNSIIISNQSKYYLAINRENFLQIQYGFCRHALLIHYHLWQLVIERACTKNSRKLMQICFFDRRSWNNECPGKWLVFD